QSERRNRWHPHVHSLQHAGLAHPRAPRPDTLHALPAGRLPGEVRGLGLAERSSAETAEKPLTSTSNEGPVPSRIMGFSAQSFAEGAFSVGSASVAVLLLKR